MILFIRPIATNLNLKAVILDFGKDISYLKLVSELGEIKRYS